MDIYSPGERIAERYLVAGRPLMGGMGIVYLCTDIETSRPVALKTWRPEFLPDRPARDRFLREGTAWVRLGAHPHVVRAYSVERIGDGRQVFLVLELVAKELGRPDASLRALLVPGRPLAPYLALLYALQATRGLAYAASRLEGFVHRDLKPENLLVGADRLTYVSTNRLRVTDFGLARVLEGGSAGAAGALLVPAGASRGLHRTQLTHGLAGTPLYMAPEQWQGGELGPWTDIYALGCILFEMLAGRRPVRGNTLESLAEAHCLGQLAPLPVAVPPAAAAFVRRCLAVTPGDRPQGWPEVERALGQAYTAATGRPVPPPEPPEVLGRPDRVTVGWSQTEIGASYRDLGQTKVAQTYFERALRAAQEEGERGLEANALGGLGLTYADLGDVPRALDCYDQALAILRQIGDRQGEGALLGSMGLAYFRLGNAERAMDYQRQALVIAREVGSQHGEAAALGNLGGSYADMGDTRGAIDQYEQALAILREAGDRQGEGEVLGMLGLAYTDLGEVQQAIGYYEQALTIRREIGDRAGEGTDLGNLGLAYAQLGEVQRAIDFHEQALAIRRETGHRRSEGQTLANLGSAYLLLGDGRRAMEYLEQALVIRREIGDRRGEGTDLGNLGIVYDTVEPQRAVAYYEQALAIRREIGDQRGEALDCYNLAQFYRQQGQIADALHLARQAAAVYATVGHASYTQAAQRLVSQLESGESAAGPLPEWLIEQFNPLIAGVVSAAHGNRDARAEVEALFSDLIRNGRRIVAPIQHIWEGERNLSALTPGTDRNSAVILGEILRQLGCVVEPAPRTGAPEAGRAPYESEAKKRKEPEQLEPETGRSARLEDGRLPDIAPEFLAITLVHARTLGAPGAGGASFQSGIQSGNSGDYAAAERHFVRALEEGLDPLREGYVRAELGEIALRNGDLIGALKQFLAVFMHREALYESVHTAAQYLAVAYRQAGRQHESSLLGQLTAKTEVVLGYRLAESAAGKVRDLAQRSQLR